MKLESLSKSGGSKVCSCGRTYVQKEISGIKYNVCRRCNKKTTVTGHHQHEIRKDSRKTSRKENQFFCSSTRVVLMVKSPELLEDCPMCGQRLNFEEVEIR